MPDSPFLADGVLGPVVWTEVARYSQFAEAIGDFLQSQLRERPVTNALFAVAGPVEGDRCSFTNCSWTIDRREMQDRFEFQTVRIVNDFEATALSLPLLMDQDLRSLGGGAQCQVPDGGSRAWIGPRSRRPRRRWSATNRCSERRWPCDLVGCLRREDAVLDHLRQRFGHVSAERVLSGQGLENLYRAIAALDEIDAPLRNASEITNAALQGACPTSRTTLDMFCAMLGGFAGNVALTYGARGGVYIAGGIAPRILDYLTGSESGRASSRRAVFERTSKLFHRW